ncbi:hypothetical protein RBWH47_05817 [Rhodopirellula baltica WH47]|uniref:Uncharacterized protein n=1 Tax=Rhodopirellula baltica WH47 TaxID=991778 RepID=F2AZ82_RHOBT|nr:hypothetical protein RBWH47_05817 [Rhodopirellula baltica WH47]
MLGTNRAGGLTSAASARVHLAHERDQIRDAFGLQSRANLDWRNRMIQEALVTE